MAPETELTLPFTAKLVTSALRLDGQVQLDVAWLSQLAQATRSEPKLHPLVKLLMDTISGNPSFAARNGRLEAWSQSGTKSLLWSLEPMDWATFPNSLSTDLLLKQRDFPGTALQLLRALPDVRIVDTEGFLKWPKVIALTKALYWDKIGEKLPVGLQKWWRTGTLQRAGLRFDNDRLHLSFQATWAQIDALCDFLLTPTSSEAVSTAPNPPSSVEKLIEAQKLGGFPAFAGTKIEIKLGVEAALANRVLAAILAQLQAVSASSVAEEADFVAPAPSISPLGFLKAVNIEFEIGRAILGVTMEI